jgi:hypothetical protein
MSTKTLTDDPVVKMLLEDVHAYFKGNALLLSEAKRSVDILKKEYDISPMFLATACDAGLSEVSELW